MNTKVWYVYWNNRGADNPGQFVLCWTGNLYPGGQVPDELLESLEEGEYVAVRRDSRALVDGNEVPPIRFLSVKDRRKELTIR